MKTYFHAVSLNFPLWRSSARGWFLCLGLTAMAASAQAPVDVRLALVIGNAAYPASPLLNPAKDAVAVGQALRKLGFTVQELQNASKTQMEQAIATLRDQLKGRNGVAMIYYAGHGVQVDYDNYLVPIDVRIVKESDIAAQALNISATIESFATSGNRLSMVVLDACRDNPFKTRQAIAGLAPRDAPKSVFLAYATEPGNVAEDGDAAAGNGLYTQFLLKELSRPAVSVDDVFKRVRFAVRRASDGQQVPSYSNGLDTPFGFDKGFAAAAPDASARAAQFALEKPHWDRIRDSKNPDDFFDFIQAYPNSSIGELAQAVLERISRRKLVAQAAIGEALQDPTEARFRKGDTYKLRTTPDRGTPILHTAQVLDVNADGVSVAGVFGPSAVAQYTLAGAVIKDQLSTYDPPYVLIPGGEYQVGKRWGGRSMRKYLTGDVQWMDYSARVVAREKITVPAGTFDTYRIEYQFQMEKGALFKSVMWAQPEWGLAIKLNYQYQDAAGNVRSSTREMLERQRGS